MTLKLIESNIRCQLVAICRLFRLQTAGSTRVAAQSSAGTV